MTSISPTGAGSTVTRNTQTDLGEINVNQFLDLLITELQHQDPLDPMDNSEMLNQLGQIREIAATNQLTDTLASVQMGQNLTTASSLIGKQVRAQVQEGEDIDVVEGVVDKVSIEVDSDDPNKRTVLVHVGDQAVELSKIRGIVEPSETE